MTNNHRLVNLKNNPDPGDKRVRSTGAGKEIAMANSCNKTFFGFALADSMFAGDCDIRRRTLVADEVKAMAGELTPCLNPSHKATIDAMRSRYGIEVAIPEAPPRVSLGVGDSVVVMGVRGLPRLTDRHEYTEEEIAAATFSFSEYTVIG